MQLSFRSCQLNFVVGLLTLSVPTLSHADVVFQTGFEPTPAETPGYSTGQLSGQNGWFSITGPVVENTTVFSGSQAVSYSASGQAGQNEIHQALSFNSLAHPGQLLIYDMEFMESASGTPSNWTTVGTSGSNGFIGAIVIDGAIGKADAGFGTLVPVSRGVWNDYELILNFQTQRMSAFVNGISLGSGAFFNSSTDITTFGFGINSVPNSDIGYWDQASVTAAPEPGSVGLLGTVIGLIALGLKKRFC